MLEVESVLQLHLREKNFCLCKDWQKGFAPALFSKPAAYAESNS